MWRRERIWRRFLFTHSMQNAVLPVGHSRVRHMLNQCSPNHPWADKVVFWTAGDEKCKVECLPPPKPTAVQAGMTGNRFGKTRTNESVTQCFYAKGTP